MRRKPLPLHPGDVLGIVAPGSAPAEPSALEAGLKTLRSRGYVVACRPLPPTPHGYLAGTDAERIDELNGFLRRPDVKALICVRGGYGALRLLPHLDYEAARAHPKLLIGYSDITALHMALYERAQWAGLAGPMAAVEWPDPDPASEVLFWDLATGATPSPLLGPAGERLVSYGPGEAEGVLLGGNLTLITRLIGTPYLPSLKGAILFLEEVAEPPYRIDGMLAQLRLSGAIEGLGGLILGGFTGAESLPGKPSLSLDDVIRDYFHDAPFPVATGLVHGHFPVKNTMPVGVRARLSVASSTAELHILEAVTSGA